MKDLCEQCHEPLPDEDDDEEPRMAGYCVDCSAERCEECQELKECCVCEDEDEETED